MQNYKEIWKDIPNYEGMYQVSNLGRVRTFKRGKKIIMRLSEDKGYFRLGLRNGVKQKRMFVHRLVALSFLGQSDLQVNHKNGIKTDNRLENLEYCTASQNRRHAFDTGLQNPVKGEDHYASKLTEDQVIEIKYGHKGKTQREIACIYGIAQGLVSRIRRGLSWKHI